MIKNYNQYIKESLLDNLKGPSEEEVLKDIRKKKPNDYLNYAANVGILNGVIEAFEKGATLKNDYRVLRNAVIGNNIDIVKLLVNKGVEYADKSMCLKEAVKNGNLEILEYLVSLGFNLNFIINVTNPFTFEYVDSGLLEDAVYYNHYEIVKYLIEKGLDTNTEYQTNYEKKPLYIAIENKNIDIIKLLLENGANISKEDKHLAKHLNNKNILSLIDEYEKN